MPNFAIETECGGIVCGIDEAGRGPLAGPVVAAAVIVDPKRLKRRVLRAIDDSKVLDRAVREALYAEIRAGARIGVAAASAAEIDRINILQATLLAMRRAVAALGVVPDIALVDGNVAPGCLAPAARWSAGMGCRSRSPRRSIVAKVTRDALMVRLAQRYPGFGWETNAGYGTAAHTSALKRLGPTPHHRRSFRPVVKMLSPREQPSHILWKTAYKLLIPKDLLTSAPARDSLSHRCATGGTYRAIDPARRLRRADERAAGGLGRHGVRRSAL